MQHVSRRNTTQQIGTADWVVGWKAAENSASYMMQSMNHSKQCLKSLLCKYDAAAFEIYHE